MPRRRSRHTVSKQENAAGKEETHPHGKATQKACPTRARLTKCSENETANRAVAYSAAVSGVASAAGASAFLAGAFLAGAFFAGAFLAGAFLAASS